MEDNQVEQDLIISRALIELFSHPEISRALAFRGGTALHKLHLKPARYSEDLDFGVEGAYQGSEAELQSTLDDATRASGINFEVTKHRELQKEAYPTHYVDIDIQYTAVLGHKNTTSLDVMIDEYVAFDSVDHRHSYEDVPEFELTAYSLEEIFAEKLRALYQRSQARDYYDLYRMITEADVDDSGILPAFTRKCDHDGLDIAVGADDLARRTFVGGDHM